MLEFIFDTTRAVAKLIFSGTLRRYPHLRIILSHAGGAVPLFAERLLDRAEILAVMRQAQAGQAAPPSQMLFGTDYPFAQNVGVDYALKGLAGYTGFSDQDRQTIEALNALSLFPHLRE